MAAQSPPAQMMISVFWLAFIAEFMMNGAETVRR
jgi:hypothetical protein